MNVVKTKNKEKGCNGNCRFHWHCCLTNPLCLPTGKTFFLHKGILVVWNWQDYFQRRGRCCVALKATHLWTIFNMEKPEFKQNSKTSVPIFLKLGSLYLLRRLGWGGNRGSKNSRRQPQLCDQHLAILHVHCKRCKGWGLDHIVVAIIVTFLLLFVDTCCAFCTFHLICFYKKA